MNTVLTGGIIGFGARGKELASIISEHVPVIKLVAAADPLKERRDEAISKGLEAYENVEELIEKVHPNIVVVATSPPDHFWPVIIAAAMGSHIFCEKPLALSPEEADEMVAAVRKAGVVCTVDFETVFAQSFYVLENCLKEDWFGRLIRFDATDKGRPPAYDIETCMPHFLHTMMKLTGSKPMEIFSRIMVDGRKATLDGVVSINDIYPQGRSHDIGMRTDSIEASYLFENGVTARFFLARLDEDYVIRAGKSAGKPGSEFMHLICYGTRGQIKFHQTQTGFVYVKDIPQDTLSNMEWKLVYRPEKPDPAWVIPTSRLINDFVEAIKNGRDPYVTIEEAAAVVDQTYGIYAAHLAGKPITLPLQDRRHPLRIN